MRPSALSFVCASKLISIQRQARSPSVHPLGEQEILKYNMSGLICSNTMQRLVLTLHEQHYHGPILPVGSDP